MARVRPPYPELVVALAVSGLLFDAVRHARRRAALAVAPDEQPASAGTAPAVWRTKHADLKDSVDLDPADRAAGADAEGPSQIPVRGWWVVMKRAAAGFLQDRVMAEAAGVTFYALLALFPAIASVISIYGLFADPARLAAQLDSMRGIVPDGGLELIDAQVKSLAASGHQALGVGLGIGVLTSLWSANAGVKAFFDALNVVYHEREQRSFVRLTIASFCFTFGIIAFLMVATVAVVVVPIALSFLGLADQTEALINVMRWPIMLVVVSMMLALLYRYGPSRTRARWQWVTWGSAFAAIGWIAVSLAFSYYVANFGSYNKTYGSLGAAVGFMTWIWISSIVVLMGAELNAELEQQTERDSTVGPEKPMGSRGAYKADVKT